MSATEALTMAQAAGIRIEVDGSDLLLKASAPPPPDLLVELTRHKTGIIALLRSDSRGWTAADWRALFDKRASTAKFANGLPRVQAEARAFACCVAEWLLRNPVRSAQAHCVHCGGGDRAHDPLLPFGTETTGHVWLHSRCWSCWHESRMAEAATALAAIGIERPILSPERD